MMIEAAVAIGSGIAAHSLTLIAFGVDSVIELLIGVRPAVASQYRAPRVRSSQKRLVNAWWVDGVTSLLIIYFVVSEGIEALRADDD